MCNYQGVVNAVVNAQSASLSSNGGFKLDWSYAGHRAGEKGSDFYRPSKRFDVKSFGAKINGVTDDSNALQNAIDACGNAGGGTVEIPSGTLLLEGQVKIRYSNVLVRGAGKGKTIIKIPHSLSYYDLMAGTDDDRYSRSRAFLEIIGNRVRSNKKGRNYVGRVVSNARAGDRSLYLESTSGISSGDWVRLYISDPKTGPVSQSLVGYMYSNPEKNAQCGESCLKSLRGSKDLVRFMSRVTYVDGNKVALERQLPVDVRTNWSPVVYTLSKDTVQKSGIQDLTIQFGWKRTQKHLDEDGNNAIVLEEAAFCWVKNVAVIDADLNVVVRYSNFVTVTGVDASVTKDRSHSTSRGKQGHIAIGIHDSCDVDVSDFTIRDTWWHDLSVRASMLSVFREGYGEDLNMDLHRSAPYMMLYDDINIGKGTRAFTTGGKSATGQPTAGFSTFWNIRQRGGEAITVPGCMYGPNLNFVGNFKSKKGCRGRLVNSSKDIVPRRLYASQVSNGGGSSTPRPPSSDEEPYNNPPASYDGDEEEPYNPPSYYGDGEEPYNPPLYYGDGEEPYNPPEM